MDLGISHHTKHTDKLVLHIKFGHMTCVSACVHNDVLMYMHTCATANYGQSSSATGDKPVQMQ